MQQIGVFFILGLILIVALSATVGYMSAQKQADSFEAQIIQKALKNLPKEKKKILTGILLEYAKK